MMAVLSRLKLGTRLLIFMGSVFLVVVLVNLLLVKAGIREFGLEEARSKAMILLDRNLATHTYFSQVLKPRVFEAVDTFRQPDYFDPVWMSSTYAVRQIDKTFKEMSSSDYYHKECAVNARSPENEADVFERAFIEEMNRDPGLMERSDIRIFEGKPFFVVMRRAETMEESCLRCHGEPAKAPADLVKVYGEDRSFQRKVGEAVSAISIRIPLSTAYAQADVSAWKLSGLLFLAMSLFLVASLWLNSRLVLSPLSLIRRKAQQIAESDVHLGEEIPVPSGRELGELTAAFNRMSIKLRESRDDLENRVIERTAEMRMTIDRLEHEIDRREKAEGTLRKALDKGRELEETLRSSHQLLHSIIESLPDAVLVVDDRRKAIAWNRAMEVMTGVTKEDILGKRIDVDSIPFNGKAIPALIDLMSAPDPEQGSRWESFERKGNSLQGEFFLPTVYDGRGAYLSGIASPLFDQDHNIIGAIESLRDITRQKEAETRLKDYSSFLQRLIDTIPSPVFYKDIHGVFLGCNSAYEALFGLERKDIVGKTVYEIAPAHLADKYHEMDMAFLVSPGLQTYEYTVQTPDGREREVIHYRSAFTSDGGELEGIVAVMLDITERKRMEKALKASEDQMRLIIESSPIGIRISKGSRFVYANPAFLKMFGFSDPGEIASLSMEDFLAPEDRDLVRQAHGKVLAGPGRISSYEVSSLKKDGSRLDTAVWNTGIEYKGEPAVLAFIIDVSTEKTLQAQLLQAQKLQAIGNLAGGIAHDFNNLLGIIMGNCEMALLDTSVNTIVQQHLEQIARASRRAKNIVKQILAFSRKSDAGRTIVDIRWIIDETVGLLKFSTTQQIDIRWNARAKGVNTAILADPNQIQQALLNLCTNSIHAMRDRKGILEIGLDVVDLTESNTPAGLKAEPGSYVKIRVSDTGHGISDEILPRIFDPYFTTKERSEGTGLGLSVVEGIVKSHNGAIQVRSQPGSGTVFDIFLPRPQVPIPAQKGEKPVDPAKGHHSILIVDDEKELLAALKSMLEHLGYLVAAASGASEAMEIFRKKPETFDLVITDHDMPGTMGSELALQIARVRSDVPIILCTGHLGDTLVDQLRDKDIRSVLLKPFSLRQLAAEVEKVLHGEKGE